MGQGRGDIIGGILLVLLAIVIFSISSGFPSTPQMGDPGSAFFPNILAVAFLLLAAGLFSEGYKQRDIAASPKDADDAKYTRMRLFFILLIAGYILAMPYIGFLISTFIFLTMIMKLCNTPGYLLPAGIAVIASITIFFAFRELLNVPLPEILIS